MLPWQQLSGVEKAVEILYNAFAKERGLLWSAILTPTARPDGSKRAGDALAWLQQYRLSGPNRFEDGYGLSPEVVDQAHAVARS